MTPEQMGAYLRVARDAGVQAFDLETEGFKLRVGLGAPLATHLPRPGEVERRLAEVDEDILYGSSGGLP